MHQKRQRTLHVDEIGLDDLDNEILKAIIYKFNGGPVGIDTISAAVSEERATIEDVCEPYLMQIGFISRTPRGRIATAAATPFGDFCLQEEKRASLEEIMGIGKTLIIIGVLFILAGFLIHAAVCGIIFLWAICPGISIFPKDIRSFISL